MSAEENYDLFERALYSVAQRGDESNDSYLALHDIAFEDLQSKGVTIDDVRAYVLVRQSTLSSEDRKKIIMDNSGKLTYEGARKSMRLLGSKFFQDLQNAGRGTQNKKTYDAYHLDEEEDYQFAYTCENDGAVDEEHLFQVMLDQGDPDAAFIHDFEDQIMETLQESEDLAQCFVSYQEARARVKERAKARGFWPVKGKQKGKGFTKKGKNQNVPMGGYNSGFRKKSLAERIANSTCRICGAAGHWKRECPQRQEPCKSDTAASMPNDVHLGFLEEDVITEEVTTELPDNAVEWQEPGKSFEVMSPQYTVNQGDLGECVDVFLGDSYQGVTVPPQSFVKQLQVRLSKCCRMHKNVTMPAAKPFQCESATSPQHRQFEPVQPSTKVEGDFSVFQMEEESHEAIIDTGASRAVIGSDRLESLVMSCGLQGKVKVAPSKVVFRFGNSGTLESTRAVFFRRKTGGWIRVEVVPGRTPFLLSNSVLKSLKAVVDVDGKVLWFKQFGQTIPLRSCRKNLMSVNFGKILEITGNNDQGLTHDIHIHEHDSTSHGDTQQEHEVTASEQEGYHQTQGHCHEKNQHEKNEVVKCLPKTVRGDEVESNFVQPMVHFQQFPNVNEPFANQQNSQAQAAPSEQINSCSETPNGGKADSGELLRSTTGGRHRCGPSNNQGLPRFGVGGVPKTTGCEHPSTMGRYSGTSRQVSGKDVRAGVCGAGIHDASQEPKGSVSMAEKFSNVQSCQDPLRQPVCGPNGSEGGDRQVGRRLQCWPEASEFPKLAEGSTDVKGASQFPSENRGMDQDRGHSESIRSRKFEAPSSTVILEQSSAGHDSGSRSSSSAAAADSDRNFTKGTGSAHQSSQRSRGTVEDSVQAAVDYIQGDASPCYLSADQEKLIHQEIALKISEVQDGLSTLPTKNAFEGDQFKLIKSNQQKPGQGRPLDLLEIYCSPNSTITTFVNKRGGHAMRFTKEDGDLNSEEGVQKLWLWIYLYEPRHIWMAPECRLWGKFANLNMSKGLDAQQRIMKERRENKKHRVLCNEIFLHQIENRRHAHLEQPSESAMTKQKELYELEQGTLKAVFDMCRVGKLKVPGDNMYLQKRTTVHTSCGYLDHHLHQKFCQHDHEHRVIQGSIKVGKTRQNITAYAAAYTASFGSFVARVILEECRSPESPITMLLDPQFWDVHAVGDDDHDRPKTAHVDSQSQKRPRYGIKGPPRGPDIAQERTRYGRAPTWESFVKGVGSRVPRVGNFVLRAMDPGFEDVQLLVPEMHVKMVLICRGTERYRVPGSLASKEEVPWRKTVIVSREDGVVQDLGPPENWAALPRLQQTRKAGSARMSITVFGTLESQQTHVSFPRGQSQGTGSVVSSGVGAVVEIPKKRGT